MYKEPVKKHGLHLEVVQSKKSESQKLKISTIDVGSSAEESHFLIGDEILAIETDQDGEKVMNDVRDQKHFAELVTSSNTPVPIKIRRTSKSKLLVY